LKTLSFDASLPQRTKLREVKITTDDLRLIDQFGIKDWNDKEFDRDMLVKYGKWVVNEDKSVIFKSLGGGSFEIPEMYDLIYRATKVHLECGGGGNQPKTFIKNADDNYDIAIFVSRIWIPPALSREQDAVLALVVEAFAVRYSSSPTSGKLTVNFDL
jgi:hypothetical protein